MRIGQVTLKIGTSDGLICFDDDSKLINVPYNEFEIEGQKGKPHYCYVYPPTRENLLVFRSREGIEKSMPDLAKKFMSQLIVANHRLNTICGVIHASKALMLLVCQRERR